MMDLSILGSVKRIVLALAVLSLLFGAMYVGAWVQRLFPSEREGVVIGRTRVVRDVQIKEVEKWKTRTIPCVDLVEIVPPGTENEPTPVVDTEGNIAPIETDRRREERAIESFQERFAGQVDLGLEALLATLDIPPGGRYGWAVAATIPRQAPPDGAARKVSLTAVENKAPFFSLGRRSEWWVGLGMRYMPREYEGISELEPALGLGFSKDAFSLKRLDFVGRVQVEYGADSGDVSGSFFLSTGMEHWRHRPKSAKRE